ncbi:MAG: hypothetical protein O9295_25790 [Microcystis sp. LE18-22.4A]|nr:hypothetical protein [Microcystis sp. LE18-22.4A]
MRQLPHFPISPFPHFPTSPHPTPHTPHPTLINRNRVAHYPVSI